MKDNFWTFLKVLIALGVSIFIYNFFTGEFSPNAGQSFLIKSSLEMLSDILTESVNDNATGESVRKNFKSFSEKVSKGEITPEEFQDVAAAILNIRMEEEINLDSELKKIILNMEFAQKETGLMKLSHKALDEKYESIALKIEELAAFQEENIPYLILKDQWSKITSSLESLTAKKNRNGEIIIAYEPAVPIRESPTSSLNRRESNITIIESQSTIVPLIKITDDLDVLVDSMIMLHWDSTKVLHLHQSLKRLKHAKILKKLLPKKIEKATGPHNN
ncbi:MAG: hypothetical protein IIB41_07740 [Candidatus Marinimicrobia bacterium]|nr:hypothetical protein [Candidatus Neomarinimicrobiota bacterium]